MSDVTTTSTGFARTDSSTSSNGIYTGPLVTAGEGCYEGWVWEQHPETGRVMLTSTSQTFAGEGCVQMVAKAVLV